MAVTTNFTTFTPIIQTRVLDFSERPTYSKCGSPKSICSHSKPSQVLGLEENYHIIFKKYTCTNKGCSEYRKHKERLVNPYKASRHRFDYEVESVTCQQRFMYYRNYQEIKNHLKINHGVSISQKIIGNIIKLYEFSCKMHDVDQVFEELKKNGGTVIHIDAVAPLKGESKHVVAIDHFTRRTVLVEKVKSENTRNHVKIQQKLKKLLKYNNIEVLGFMSDDHVAQRKAIQEVWGKKMKHSRCIFHFTRRILNKPFEQNRNLLTKARSKLRKIYPVLFYRLEKGILTGKGTYWLALCAGARKLLTIIWYLLKSGSQWKVQTAPKKIIQKIKILAIRKQKLLENRLQKFEKINKKLTREENTIIDEMVQSMSTLNQVLKVLLQSV